MEKEAEIIERGQKKLEFLTLEKVEDAKMIESLNSKLNHA